MTKFHGEAGDDSLSGTTGDDIFNLKQGGEDSATGDDGNDSFRLGATLSAGDEIGGGTGNDKLSLEGDYSGGFTFGANSIVSIEALRLAGAFDYALTMNDANVAAGDHLMVNAAPLTAGHHLTFDGSAETDGHFTVYASAGNDVLTGGARRDKFNLSQGGNDIAHGGGGNDIFLLHGALTPSDQIDGGAGYDTLVLDGNYAGGEDGIFFNAATMTGIDRLELRGGAYQLGLTDGNVAAGETLVIDASQATQQVSVNAGSETDGHLYVIARAGTSYFSGGAQSDTFDMRLVPLNMGSIASGNGGDDVILYGAGFKFGITAAYAGAGNDTLSFDGDYSALHISPTSSATEVENLVFHGGHDYTSVVIDHDVTAGPFTISGNTLHIDASELGASDVFSADVSGGTSAAYDIALGAGNDTIALSGSGANSVTGGGGADTITCNAAVDTLIYTASSESASVNYDTVSGFNADQDKFDLFFSVSNVDAQSFSVDSSSFNANMGTHLSDYICTVVTANGGDLLGHKFLVINADTGNGYSYEAGVDLVIDITGYTGTLDTGDFT